MKSVKPKKVEIISFFPILFRSFLICLSLT